MRPVRKVVYAKVEAGECENWDKKKIREERLFTRALKESGNIAYVWIGPGKTDCLSRD